LLCKCIVIKKTKVSGQTPKGVAGWTPQDTTGQTKVPGSGSDTPPAYGDCKTPCAQKEAEQKHTIQNQKRTRGANTNQSYR
jgi:hypothetical protein